VDFRDPRRDKEHGRIWRIAATGRPVVPKLDFTKLKNQQLLDLLLSPDGFAQEQAKRVLIERGASAVRKDLTAWAKRHDTETAQLQALWMYEALNPAPLDTATRELAIRLLNAKEGRIRAAAVRALANGIETVPDALGLLGKLVTDDHPRVRLEAVRALGNISNGPAAELALNVLNRPMDPFLDYALWLTVNELAQPWVAAVKSGAWKPEGHERQVEFALKAVEPELAGKVLGQLLAGKALPRDGSGPWIEIIGSSGDAAKLTLIFDPLTREGFDDAATLRALAALSDAARLRDQRPKGQLAPKRSGSTR